MHLLQLFSSHMHANIGLEQMLSHPQHVQLLRMLLSYTLPHGSTSRKPLSQYPLHVPLVLMRLFDTPLRENMRKKQRFPLLQNVNWNQMLLLHSLQHANNIRKPPSRNLHHVNNTLSLLLTFPLRGMPWQMRPMSFLQHELQILTLPHCFPPQMILCQCWMLAFSPAR